MKRRAHAKGLVLAIVAALRVLDEKGQAGCRRFLCVRWAPGPKTCRYEVPRALTLDRVPPTDVGLPNADVRPGQRVFSAPAPSSVCSVDVACSFSSLARAPRARAGRYLQDGRATPILVRVLAHFRRRFVVF
ncbi:hypothetical protein HPB52_005323 [Rhipicephalus sanguineus]|uniref:Secreted protein n=1 Tax=Rhipicephalus sanguineus TaxID=34632 RepID=A0A9D4SS18_RHISA|nr:hypothetical protein HPB52_005323 [Rhipicephalus sanguineus]